MEREIHGDRDCPVILTVSGKDAERNAAGETRMASAHGVGPAAA